MQFLTKIIGKLHLALREPSKPKRALVCWNCRLYADDEQLWEQTGLCRILSDGQHIAFHYPQIIEDHFYFSCAFS